MHNRWRAMLGITGRYQSCFTSNCVPFVFGKAWTYDLHNTLIVRSRCNERVFNMVVASEMSFASYIYRMLCCILVSRDLSISGKSTTFVAFGCAFFHFLSHFTSSAFFYSRLKIDRSNCKRDFKKMSWKWMYINEHTFSRRFSVSPFMLHKKCMDLVKPIVSFVSNLCVKLQCALQMIYNWNGKIGLTVQNAIEFYWNRKMFWDREKMVFNLV